MTEEELDDLRRVASEPLVQSLVEATEYLELDPDEPEIWERDLLRAIAAAQKALVMVRSRSA